MKNEFLLSLLQRLELSKKSDFHYACPICDENFAKHGHRFDCDLAKAIQDIGGTVKIQDELGCLQKIPFAPEQEYPNQNNEH